MMKVMITIEQLEKIRKYFATQPVEVVYLYGSQATGDSHSRSDYDFGVVFTESIDKSKRFDKKLEYMAELGSIVGTDRVEVLDLNSAPVYYQYSAIAPRKDIYVKDEGKRIDFESNVLSRYFDRLLYLKRHTYSSLSTIALEGL